MATSIFLGFCFFIIPASVKISSSVVVYVPSIADNACALRRYRGRIQNIEFDSRRQAPFSSPIAPIASLNLNAISPRFNGGGRELGTQTLSSYKVEINRPVGGQISIIHFIGPYNLNATLYSYTPPPIK